MMPVHSHQIQGGSRVILHTCEDCGRPAPFEAAGKWYCGYLNGNPQCVASSSTERNVA